VNASPAKSSYGKYARASANCDEFIPEVDYKALKKEQDNAHSRKSLCAPGQILFYDNPRNSTRNTGVYAGRKNAFCRTGITTVKGLAQSNVLETSSNLNEEDGAREEVQGRDSMANMAKMN